MMTAQHALRAFLTLVLAGWVTASAFADVAQPIIPKGKGERCVADTSVMRRNHMEMLKHQRDDTVHNGIRTARFSLAGCMNCHAYVNEQPVSIKDQRHFCNACHQYTAVKIDCFECHASTPQPPGATVTAERRL
ncbi:MAG: Hdr-like menaquinol oxidoreductase cytochrome c subunit [Pseudomonadota bacterium]